MPAFLVELAEDEKATLQDNKLGKVVVWAATAADAKDVAKASSEGDSGAAWEAATATDLSTVQNFSHMSVDVSVIAPLGAPPAIDRVVLADVAVPMPTGNVVKTIVINGQGTGYSVNDIITVATGTAGRHATARVTAETTGNIDAIELVDPGDNYTVNPSATAGATTGGNADATVDITVVANDYHNIMGAIVTALNATSIAGAAMDFGTGSGGTLTIASGSGGDDKGDHSVDMKWYVTADASKQPIDGMVGTITHEGATTAVLSALGMATQVSGKVLATL